MASARFGRMEIGSCVTFEVGMGCFNDILQTADRWCSGRRDCTIENDKNEMDEQLGLPCPEELASYIEIKHDCVAGEVTLVFKTTWEIRKTWELGVATSVPTPTPYTERADK